MLETWVNNWGYCQTATYHKNNLTFREAAYETIKDIRARTNKTLVIPLSGGSDSALAYNITRDLGIEVKTVHQRYWDGDRLINEYESRNVDPDTVDIFQDIDCTPGSEFRTSPWLKELYEVYCPYPYFAGLQCWIKTLDDINPENDFIIYGGNPCVGEINPENNTMKWSRPSAYWIAGHKEFEYAGLLDDNATILYTLFNQTTRDMIKGLNLKGYHDYEGLIKQKIFEHNFPEFNHVLKDPHGFWGNWLWAEDGTTHGIPGGWRELRKEYGPSRGYIIHCSYWSPMDKLDLFYDCIDNNVPIAGEFCPWDWSGLTDYGKEKLQNKIFTDKIEYYPSSKPWSNPF